MAKSTTPEQTNKQKKNFPSWLTLGGATEWFHSGQITGEEFDEYYHLWWTSAPRISSTPCNCQICQDTLIMNAQEFAKKFGYKVEYGNVVICASFKDAEASLMVAGFSPVIGSKSTWKKDRQFVTISPVGGVFFND